MKTFKTPLIALGLLALMGLYIHFFEKGPAKDPDAPIQGERIFQKAADDVTAFALEFPADPKTKPIELVKDAAGKWSVTKPVSLEGDESYIRNLLNTLSEARLENELADQKNLADYGLNTPSARYTVKLKDGSVFHLETGDKNLNATAFFTRVDTRPGIGMLPADVIGSLGRSLRDYRNKTAFKADLSELSRIRIKGPRGAIVLEKAKTGDWNLTEPRKEPASSDMIRQFLSGVEAYRYAEFPDDHPTSLTKYGLDPPRASLEVWREETGKSRSLWVGKKDGMNVYVKDRDQSFVAMVGEALYKLLADKKPEEFKSKEAMKFNEAQAVRLVLRKGARAVTFTKDASGSWKCPERPSAPTEAPPLLAQLSSTMVLEFVPPGTAAGLSEPSAVAEVTLNQNEVRIFKFGKRKEDKVYLASDRSRDLYLVSGYVLAQIEGLLAPTPPAPAPAAK